MFYLGRDLIDPNEVCFRLSKTLDDKAGVSQKEIDRPTRDFQHFHWTHTFTQVYVACITFFINKYKRQRHFGHLLKNAMFTKHFWNEVFHRFLSAPVLSQDQEHIAFWNSVVRGQRAGDGWVLCDLDEESLEILDRRGDVGKVMDKNCGNEMSLIYWLSSWSSSSFHGSVQSWIFWTSSIKMWESTCINRQQKIKILSDHFNEDIEQQVISDIWPFAFTHTHTCHCQTDTVRLEKENPIETLKRCGHTGFCGCTFDRVWASWCSGLFQAVCFKMPGEYLFLSRWSSLNISNHKLFFSCSTKTCFFSVCSQKRVRTISGRMMISGSSSSNVDGRWLARGHTGTKVIDGDVVQYGTGLSTTLAWESGWKKIKSFFWGGFVSSVWWRCFF